MVESPIRSASALPEEPTQASRFGKARTAQSGALLEDYVELISDLLTIGGEARPTISPGAWVWPMRPRSRRSGD